MAIDKIYMRIEGSEGVSEWVVRHPFSLENIRNNSEPMRSGYDVITPCLTPGDVEGTWILRISVLDRAGVEADATEGETDVER
jgi:hypothetical protein